MFTTVKEHLKGRAPIIVVIGDPGVGKTTLIKTLPKPVAVLDYEGGLQPLANEPKEHFVVADLTKHKASAVVEQVSKMENIKSIAFDGFSNWIRYVMDTLTNGKTPTLKAWGDMTNGVNSLLLKLTRIRKPIYFTCGAVERNGQIYPDVPPSVGKTLRYLADFYGLLVVGENGQRKIIVQSENFRGKVRTANNQVTVFNPNLSEIIGIVLNGSAKEEIRYEEENGIEKLSSAIEDGVDTDEVFDDLEQQLENGIQNGEPSDDRLTILKGELLIHTPFQVIKHACEMFNVRLSDVTIESKKRFGTMKLNDLSKDQAWQLVLWIYENQE